MSGEFKGDWVSVWGSYSFTENGADIVLPYQYTARVENGKIAESSVYCDRLGWLEKWAML